METFPKNRLAVAPVAGALVVLPFVVLELINRPPQVPFPFALFGFMWLLGSLAILIAGRKAERVALAAIIVLLLAVIAFDQMPCFLGAPNCD